MATVLLVFSNFGDDPSVVTGAIGVEPSGIARSGWSSFQKSTDWILEAPQRMPKSVGEQLLILTEIVEGHAAEVRAAAQQFECKISISINDDDLNKFEDGDSARFGTIDLPASAVAAVAKLGIGIEINISAGLDADERLSE